MSMADNTNIIQQRLTMLTAAETRQLATAAQELDQIDETLIYKYREEFLHIQAAAVNGVTRLDMLVEDPQEFSQVCTAWGFAATVADKFSSKIVYRRAQSEQTVTTQLSNITVDWAAPRRPTIDVELYRQSGNLVKLDTANIQIPELNRLTTALNITAQGYQVSKNLVAAAQRGDIPNASKTGIGAEFVIAIQYNQPYTIVTITNPGQSYSEGDTIVIPQYALSTDDSTGAVITVERVAQTQLVTPTVSERGQVRSDVTVIPQGGILNCSISGSAGATGIISAQKLYKDNQILGRSKFLK